MKKMIMFFIVLSACTAVFAQDQYNRNYNSNNYNAYSTTPSKVQRGWDKYHPANTSTNTNPQWMKDGRQWDAHYRDQNTNLSVDEHYNRRGKMIDTHREWDHRDLPSGFDNRVWDRYHTRNYKVTRIDRPRNQSLFQLFLNIGTGSTRTVYVDQQGNEVRYRDRH